MILLLGVVEAVLGAWLFASAFVLSFATVVSVSNAVLGALIVAMGLACVFRRGRQGLAVVGAFAGIASAVVGVIALFGSLSGLSSLLTGLVSAAVFCLMLPFMIEPEVAVFRNKSGNELASFSSIRQKDSNLIAKAVLLGSMPQTIYVSPEELVKAVALLDDKVVLHLLGTLYRGWRGNRAAQSAQGNEAG